MGDGLDPVKTFLLPSLITVQNLDAKFYCSRSNHIAVGKGS